MTEQSPRPPARWLAPVLLGVSLFVAVVIGTAALVTASRQPAPAVEAPAADTVYTGTLVEPPVVLQDFTLPASTGGMVSLRDLHGRWTLLFFGYTHCPDFCPTTLVDFRQIKRALGEDAAEVAFVFVSVDAERDTPEVLARYLAPFDPDFIGLSADEATLQRIQPDFGMYYAIRRDTAPANRPDLYLVDHSTRTYLIDPQGRLRMTFAYNTGVSIITERIRAYLG